MAESAAQGVYVDVLIATNFILDYLLLSLSGKLSGRHDSRPRVGKFRLLAAAFAGSLFSLIIFLPDLSPGLELVAKLLAAGLMVRLANRYAGLWQLLKEWVILFIVTALFGGIMLAVWVSFVPNFMLCANGVVYFHLSPILLIINVTLAYALVSLADRLLLSSHISQGVYPVTLTLLGKSEKLTGFVDTGNSLTEPFSGLPVIVCGVKAVQSLLPESLLTYLQNPAQGAEPEEYMSKIRMIPYSAVGSGGLLPALRGDLLIIEDGKSATGQRAEAFFVAVSREEVGDGRYNLLLTQNLMKAGVFTHL